MLGEHHPDRRRRATALALLALGAALVVVAAFVVWRAASAPAPGAGGGVAGGAPLARGAGVGQAGVRATAKEIAEATDAARVYLRKGEAAKAEAILSALTARAAHSQDAHTLLAEAHLALGRPADALRAYEAALAIGPETAPLAFAAGSAASMATRNEEAQRWFARAQSLDPSNPQSPLYLAQVQRRAGKIDEAKASLLLAARLDPELAPAWGTLADIALEEGNLSVARGHIARARKAEPDSATWRLIEARILRRDNEPERAATMLMAMGEERLIAEPALLREAAACLGMLGRPGDAASLYVRASSRAREDAGLALEAAQWLDRAGRRDDAIVFAGAAERLGNEEARALRARLEARAP